MTPEELRRRISVFAVDVSTLVTLFRKEPATDIITSQLVRSAESAAAHYRATARAESPKTLRSTVRLVLEEIDDCITWLEFIRDAELISRSETERVIKDARELASIVVTSRRVVKNEAPKSLGADTRRPSARRVRR